MKAYRMPDTQSMVAMTPAAPMIPHTGIAHQHPATVSTNTTAFT